MRDIEDFYADDINIIEATLQKRYGKPTVVHLADTELRLDPNIPVLTTCPTLYWQDNNNSVHFVVCTLGKMRYHGQFFYRGNEPFGTCVQFYDDLHQCVITTL